MVINNDSKADSKYDNESERNKDAKKIHIQDKPKMPINYEII